LRLTETYKNEGLAHFANRRRLGRKLDFLEKQLELMFTKLNYSMRKDALKLKVEERVMLDCVYELSLRSVDERKLGRYDVCFIESTWNLP
jgi:hypothetical protein